MFEDHEIDFYQSVDGKLDVTYANMVKSDIKIQFFAIYLAQRLEHPNFEHYLTYINIFYQKIIKPGYMKLIKNQADLNLVINGHERGALLTLEGAAAIQGNSLYTHTLYHLGVRMIGITWNYANWAADGVLEPRQGGFSLKGKNFVKECNKLGILLDVSHLSERAFWDLAETSSQPFVASHSNAKAICAHPRNLDDDQIRAIIEKDGRIGITFVPFFVGEPHNETIEQLLKHIEHICALGGQKQIVLGSDFDGIDERIPGLEHAGQFGGLVQHLSKYYKDEWIKDLLHNNWNRYLQTNLPAY
ncbi:membrane dipeptidase [Paenibacillus sp. S3N08]|uniref:Membrane dipeptidase n=2 Tax=Paenibacillus agricola TaxID=2716264 RepID=A0ABX0J074_9BACL|nr:membrane dipeptidase [Paenibacillus agricola]